MITLSSPHSIKLLNPKQTNFFLDEPKFLHHSKEIEEAQQGCPSLLEARLSRHREDHHQERGIFQKHHSSAKGINY